MRSRLAPLTSRHGHQMLRAAAIVSDHPGCSKCFVARRISPHPIPSKNWALGYEPINRAIRAGLIRAEAGTGNSYALYPTDEQ